MGVIRGQEIRYTTRREFVYSIGTLLPYSKRVSLQKLAKESNRDALLDLSMIRKPAAVNNGYHALPKPDFSNDLHTKNSFYCFCILLA